MCASVIGTYSDDLGDTTGDDVGLVPVLLL